MNTTVKIAGKVYKDFVLNILLGALLVWTLSTLLYVLVTDNDLPVVSVSNSTGECVSVDPAGSCDAVPDKYIHQWVK